MTENAEHPWLAHYPEKVDWHANLRPKPVYDMLDSAAERFPENICVDFKGRTFTYADIAEQVRSFARGLHEIGIGRGSKVGLFLPNCPQFIVAYYGVMRAGATVVNFNPLYSPREIEHQINDSGVEVMVTLALSIMYPKLVPFIGTTSLQRVIVGQLSDALPAGKAALFQLAKMKDICSFPDDEHHISWKRLMETKSEVRTARIDPYKHVAVLQYTGGTTGTPKGVVLTHANLTVNVEQAARWLYEAEDGKETMMGVLPFFHVFAMTVVMNLGIAKAMKIIIHPRFELKPLLADIEAKKPTIMPGVPTMYTALLNYSKSDKYDLSSLKMCISGGAPLPVEIKEQFEEKTGCKLVEGYGLSESSPIVAVNPLYGTIKSGSIGQPLPGTILEVISLEDEKTLMPQGEKGEICIRGPQVMQGYYEQFDETMEVLRPTGQGSEMRLHTGDIGYMDEEGFFYIIDRKKEMILSGGYNIYPRNIEEVLYQHEAIAECAVVGIEHKSRGQVPKAFIVLKEGATLDAAECKEFMKDKISLYAIPSAFEFRDELPKSMIGKILKKELLAEEASSNA